MRRKLQIEFGLFIQIQVDIKFLYQITSVIVLISNLFHCLGEEKEAPTSWLEVDTEKSEGG